MFAEYDFFHAIVLLIGMALYTGGTLAFASPRIDGGSPRAVACPLPLAGQDCDANKSHRL